MNWTKYVVIISALAAIVSAYYQYKQYTELKAQSEPCNCQEQAAAGPL